jgi:DNA-binding IclR family transcriptional regulator
MPQKPDNTSSTTLKALRVLEEVAQFARPVTKTEIVERTGFDLSTTYRLLMTLVEAGYLIRDEQTKRFRLSYKVVTLSRNLIADNEISEMIHKALKKISDATGESVSLSMLDGMESVLVQQVKGTQLVNVNYQIGDRSVLHCTSIGKVLLAFQDIRVFDQYTSTELKKYASNTITNRDDLARELQIIRSQGYAFDDHELNDSMRCVAVPVFESGGVVTRGISISGPDSRFTLERLNELKVPMLEAARELSGYLGGQPWNLRK